MFVDFSGMVVTARPRPLAFKGFCEALGVNDKAVFPRQVVDDFKRQTARVLKEKRLVAGKRPSAGGFNFTGAFVEILQPVAERSRK